MALRYVGAPVQPGDLIYLKAWKNYVPGYVGWAEEHEGGIVSVISSAMGGGVFTSKETHKKLANWVPESKKATAAVVFKVNKDGDKVYLQADNVDGHSLGVSKAVVNGSSGNIIVLTSYRDTSCAIPGVASYMTHHRI